MDNKIYDIAIIGGGPAGMTAACYALRENKSVLLFEKDELGGQILNTDLIENIPGFSQIDGIGFANRMENQMVRLAAHDQLMIQNIEVTWFERSTTSDPFCLSTFDGDFYSKAIIIATGCKYRTLGVPGEAELIGRGISFCAICDAPFTRGKVVAIIGGGDSALTEALYLSNFAAHVIIFQDLGHLTASLKLQDKCHNKNNITICLNSEVQSFDKTDRIDISVNNTIYSVDKVFEAVGMIPNTEAFKWGCDINSRGYIENCILGVFCAGDCREKKIRQVVTACADGAEAAIQACNYLKNFNFF